MRVYQLLILLLTINLLSTAQINPPKAYLQDQTLDYYTLINEYKLMAEQSNQISMLSYGLTDSGKPLHLVVISANGESNIEQIKDQGKLVVLINNGIHPGEPAGIEASLQLAAQLVDTKHAMHKVLESTVVCIIPSYSIGGMLNRSPYNRANQNGPEECGFRGNSRNIDLNRDFIICQTQNAKSFTRIFQEWMPDVFLETHTTDGSDHQQTLTLISTAHQDLPQPMSSFMRDKMEPELYKMMEENSEYLMCPYVHVWRKPPDDGFQQFLETPRYSTGYASLFNSLAFMTENHIFKPFEDRVISCLDFMHCLLDFSHDNAKEIRQIRKETFETQARQQEFTLSWKIDSSKYKMIPFNGFEAGYKPGKLSGEPLLFYDRTKPYTKEVKYFNHFNPEITKKAPAYYIVPQAWHEAIERLKLNKVSMHRLKEDTSISCEMYYIDDYSTYKSAYNGHYPHYQVKTSSKQMLVNFYAGDYVIPVKGNNKQYLLHTLEPDAPDSFFAWNLFDEILQSREYFSPFIFEERAIQILDTTPGLKEKLAEAIVKNPKMEKDTYLQMRFIYRNSPYFEKTYRRYPVGRINAIEDLVLTSGLF